MELLKNNWKIVLAVIIVVGAYAFGRYLQPAKIETKTETVIQVQEKIVTKIEYVEKNKIQRHIIEMKYPDGTSKTETWEIYETTIAMETQETIDLREEVKQLREKIVTNEKPQWKANALAGFDVNDKTMIYGGSVERRILGPVFVGGWGNNKQQFGLSAGMEF